MMGLYEPYRCGQLIIMAQGDIWQTYVHDQAFWNFYVTFWASFFFLFTPVNHSWVTEDGNVNRAMTSNEIRNII